MSKERAAGAIDERGEGNARIVGLNLLPTAEVAGQRPHRSLVPAAVEEILRLGVAMLSSTGSRAPQVFPDPAACFRLRTVGAARP